MFKICYDKYYNKFFLVCQQQKQKPISFLNIQKIKFNKYISKKHKKPLSPSFS